MRARRVAFALAVALVLAVLGSDPARGDDEDDVVFGGPPPAHTSLELEPWLRVWSARLGRVLVTQPELATTEIAFETCDVPLTWGLARHVLALHGLEVELVDFRRLDPEKHTDVVAQRGGIVFRPRPAIHEAGARSTPLFTFPILEQRTAILRLANPDEAPAIERLVLDVRKINSARSGHVAAVPGSGLLLVGGTEVEVDYWTRVIRALDAAPPAVPHFARVERASAADVAHVVARLLPGDATAHVLGDEAAGLVYVAANPEDVAGADELVRDLDVTKGTLRSAGLRLRARVGEGGVAVLGLGLSGLALMWAALIFVARRARRRARVPS